MKRKSIGTILAASALALGPAGPLPAIADAPAGVVISEVESQDGDPGDWIEITNNSQAAVDISGWSLADNQDREGDFTFAPGTSIAPGQYIVVDENDDPTLGITFGLGRADEVRIFDAGGRLVDSFAWEEHAATTYGRCPDATGDLRETANPTRGAANDCSSPLRINEVVSSGGEPGDWVEIINPSGADVDASGLVFKDDNDSRDFAIADGTVVPAGGYLVLDEADFGFGLGGADSARLFDTDGTTLIDGFTWAAHGSPSWGRCVDGTGEFVQTASATKGAANDCPTVDGQDGVVINEIESNQGVPGDWVELLNTSDADINIGGWWILDNDPTHAPGTIAHGTVIPAGGFHVVEESVLGFGLGGNDEVNLYASNGELVDHHAWNGHSPSTLGRCPDGTGEFPG